MMGLSMNNSNRKMYIDVLNILSCIAVLSLHHNGMVHSFENSLAWRESLVIECGFYWAVPVFMMLSGVTLLNYRSKYDTEQFFRKRIRRTVIPWFAWSVILLIWKLETKQMTIEASGTIDIFAQIANLIFNNKVESAYWFFGALFACYLAIPVFSLLISNRSILWYIVVLNFVFLSILPVVKTWFGFSFSLDIPVVGSMIIFVVLGFLLDTKDINKKHRRLLYLVGIMSCLFRYFYTLLLSTESGVTDTSIKGYLIFHGVLYSVAVFVFLRQINWERILPENIKDVLPLLSSCSFGIFLIHKVVMYYESNLLLWLFDIDKRSIIWRLLLIPMTYVVCLSIILLMKQIPVVKRIVG